MKPALTPSPPLMRACPSAALAETVESFSQRRVDGPPVALSIFPTARAELIFHFGDPFLAGATTQTTRPLAPATLLGPRARPYWQIAGPRIDWFMIALTPAGCRRLLGAPMADLWDCDVPLDRFWGALAQTLHADLAETGAFSARMVIIEKALSGLDNRRSVDEVAAAAAAARSGSVRTIAQMCEFLEVGPRRLRQRFATEIGIAPKDFLSIMRFGRHISAIHPSPWVKTGDACATEYVDESHATRAFRRFANITPGAYRRAKATMSDSLIFTSQSIELSAGAQPVE